MDKKNVDFKTQFIRTTSIACTSEPQVSIKAQMIIIFKKIFFKEIGSSSPEGWRHSKFH